MHDNPTKDVEDGLTNIEEPTSTKPSSEDLKVYRRLRSLATKAIKARKKKRNKTAKSSRKRNRK
jgi:hypothetical protein